MLRATSLPPAYGGAHHPGPALIHTRETLAAWEASAHGLRGERAAYRDATLATPARASRPLPSATRA